MDADVSRHEDIINRLVRKVNAKMAVAHLTRFGTHGYIAQSGEDGILFRDMFPVAGKITYVYLFIGNVDVGEKEKKVAELLIAIESKNSVTATRGIKIVEGMHEAIVNIAISAGDRLLVKCDKPLKDVWFALVIEPTPYLKALNTVAAVDALEVIS